MESIPEIVFGVRFAAISVKKENASSKFFSDIWQADQIGE